MTFTQAETRSFEDLIRKAELAGLRAALEAKPAPFAVDRVDLDGNVLESFPADFAREGVFAGACGFAWVTVRPAKSRFAQWLKSKALGRKAYPGSGWEIWIGNAHIPKCVDKYGQSVEIKEAYAKAFSEVLKAAGIDATYSSRLD